MLLGPARTSLCPAGRELCLLASPCLPSHQEVAVTRSPYEVQPIGWVESPLVDREAAPKQGYEGSLDAWLVFNADMGEGIRDLQVDSEVIVLTWLDRAQRDVLVVRPRDELRNAEMGVFSTRSQDRPNPGRAAPRSHRLDQWHEGARAKFGGIRRDANRRRQAGT